MIHIRTDGEHSNSKRYFACGIGPELPEGDQYVFLSEHNLHWRVNCKECLRSLYSDSVGEVEPPKMGTPISELGTQPGQPGYEKFRAIARSWGYD